MRKALSLLVAALATFASAQATPIRDLNGRSVYPCEFLQAEGDASTGTPGPLLTYRVEVDGSSPELYRGGGRNADGESDTGAAPVPGTFRPGSRLVASFTVQDIGAVYEGVPGCVREVTMASEWTHVVEGGAVLPVGVHGLDALALPRLAVLHGADGQVVEILEHVTDAERYCT